MDHQGRFAPDSSSLTSVETMPSPKTEVRPPPHSYRKLSRRRSSLREHSNLQREHSMNESKLTSETEEETDGSAETDDNVKNSLMIIQNNDNLYHHQDMHASSGHDSGFHGIESRLLRRIDDSDDTDSLGKKIVYILEFQLSKKKKV